MTKSFKSSVPAYRGTAYIHDSSAYTAYSVLWLIGTAYSTGARPRALECAGHYAGMIAACAYICTNDVLILMAAESNVYEIKYEVIYAAYW